MSSPRTAVIYIDHDRPHPDKQEAMALRHAEELGLRVVALCTAPPACVGVVRSGAAEVVVAALDPGDEFIRGVGQVGGTVVVARCARRREPPRGYGELAERMHSQGLVPRQIAAVLEVTTGRIREVLRRAGIRPRDDPADE